MSPSAAHRWLGAAAFGLPALVVAVAVAVALSGGLADVGEQWALVAAAAAVGAAVGAAEAPRLATDHPGLRGVARVTAVAFLASVVLAGAAAGVAVGLGESGLASGLIAAQEEFATWLGFGLVCGSLLYLPVVAAWATVGVALFAVGLRRRRAA